MSSVKPHSETRNYSDWAEAEEGMVFESVFAQLSQEKETVNDQDLYLIRAMDSYLGRRNNTYDKFLYPKTYNNPINSLNNLVYNVIESGIDTLVAKISEVDIMPKAVTNKSTAEGRALADKINYVINGLYNRYNIKQVILDSYRDAMVWRTGFNKIALDENNKLFIDRIYRNEAIIDILDGYYNNNYKFIQNKLVPKNVLLRNFKSYSNYKEIRDKIEELAPIEIRVGESNFVTIGVVVAECWAKNSYVKNGRHVLCIQNMDILDEDWDNDYLPILKTDFQRPLIGFEGNSVVDMGWSMQQEINRLLSKAQRILKKLCSPKVLIDTRSDFNKDKFTNDVAEFVPYDGGGGNAPVIMNGSALPPEIRPMIEFLIASFYAKLGLNPTDIQGIKPMGLESGEALKTMTDISSKRWNQIKLQVQRTHVEFVDVVLKTVQGKNIELSAIDNKIGLTVVNTKDLPRDANSYFLQTYPISALPSDPAGRIDTMEKYVKLGVVPQNIVPEFFNMPDLSEYVAIEGAPRELAQRTIENIIKTKEYISPEIYDDLQSCIEYAQKYYCFERLNDADEEVLKLLRRFMKDSIECIKKKQEELQNAAGIQSGNPASPGANPNPTAPPGAVPGVQIPANAGISPGTSAGSIPAA